jgi:phosphate transport system ATP-binding protein
MSIYENIAYGCRIHGIRNRRKLNMIVKHYLHAAGLWEEVKDRLRTPAVRLSVDSSNVCAARSWPWNRILFLPTRATSD